jgi:hypothetical protein
MNAAEVRRRRAEAEARLKSDQRAYERSLGEHRDFIRDLRNQCPHEHKKEDAAQYVHECVCEDCGAVLSI